jgi:hypothetical protein
MVALVGALGFLMSVADLVDHYGTPEEPRPVTLQDILDGKAGPGDYVEVRDYRLCDNYVRSWDRTGRTNEDRLWCTGLVAGGLSTRGGADCTRPRIIYKPLGTYAAKPFLEEFQKRGVLRGRLGTDIGTSAYEQERIKASYPHLDRTCLELHEVPPPRELGDIRRNLLVGGAMMLLGFAFTPPGRRLLSRLARRLRKRPPGPEC